MNVTGWAGNFQGVPSLRSPMEFLPLKKDREDMQIISSQPFFHNDFLMARCRPIGHPERRNLPVWGDQDLSRLWAERTPAAMHPVPWGVRFLHSAPLRSK